jgi:hypothetical protein
VLVNVTSRVSVWPTSRAPNRKLEGEELSCAAAVKLKGAMQSNAIARWLVLKPALRAER